MMSPAREVGGDFYDFFLLDQDRLCVVIGDVSGKGVPAALFMSVTKYLLEAAVGAGETPDRVLHRVNNHLARNNESCMFVTIFLGILNLRTGEFLYANAGHNSPLLVEPDQEALFLEKPSGPVLGVLEDAPYRLDRRAVKPGSLLVIYTDGVTEAFNIKDELFSEERLRDTIIPIHDKTPREITDVLLAAIDGFAAGVPQADDITVVAVRFKGWTTELSAGPIAPGIIE
jgi:phosphoserine phosphatase RsbU/P